MFTQYLRGFLKALAQPRTPHSAGAAPRLRFVYANEGAPARYRVDHAIEASQLSGMHAEATSLADPAQLYRLHHADILILHRTGLGPRTMLLLLLARKLGVRVAFDSDDLTWDVRQRQYEFLDRHYSPAQIHQILRGARRTLALIRRVDACILSTPYLASQAHAAAQRPAYVLPNAVSAEMQACSEAALAAAVQADPILRIGYFSGHARVHDEDLASIGAVLAQLFTIYPQLGMTLVGEVALPHELAPFAHRIERRGAVGWRDLPGEIRRVAINIAPLIDNPQRRSKSAVKYLEAALAGVPTVAVAMEPYQETVQHGQTGLLAGTPQEWYQALDSLVCSPDLRQRLGNAARQHVLAEHTTSIRAAQLETLMRAILAGASK